ncbi:MAG: hypothetical protein Homavirus5_3 [Homavirus sp.]|uniref:Uncharacterized protein n=1 Tax=Homavirus sp. TaxID=2487769 RepID=A0A3G5A754_9VIRU|nr:MAG: hypothetical protein Homavirus5_3 [Homavirus sp.]
MSYIGPLTQDLLNTCINVFNKKQNRLKISKQVIHPIILEIKQYFYTYYLLFIMLQFIIICLLIYVITILKIHK